MDVSLETATEEELSHLSRRIRQLRIEQRVTKPRSKNKKRGRSDKFYVTKRTCAVNSCKKKFMQLEKFIEFIFRELPDRACYTITLFLGEIDMPINYINLHEPSNRCYHHICQKCYYNLVHDALEAGDACFLCPKHGCGVIIDVLENKVETIK